MKGNHEERPDSCRDPAAGRDTIGGETGAAGSGAGLKRCDVATDPERLAAEQYIDNFIWTHYNSL